MTEKQNPVGKVYPHTLKQEETCENCGHEKEMHSVEGKLQNMCFAHVNPVDAGLVVLEELCPCKKFTPKLAEPEEILRRMKKVDKMPKPKNHSPELTKKELKEFLEQGVTCSSGAEEYLERWFERLDKLINSPRGKDSEKEDFCAKPEGTQNQEKGCGKKLPIGNMHYKCGEDLGLGGIHLCPECQEKEK